MSKEIDFLKLYNKLDSCAYRIFSSPSTYLSILGFCGVVAYQTTVAEAYSSLLTLPITAAIGFDFYKKIDGRYKLPYLLKKIKQTSEYQECLSLYNDYITKIAELLKSLHLHNIFDTCNLIDILLKTGLFSENISYKYHNYQTELLPIEELTGARVLTGHGVCRHEAAFTTNILNRMGYKAAVIVVTKLENLVASIEKSNHKELNNTIWHHAVVGIQEKGEKVLFDSTAGKFAGRVPTLDFYAKHVALLFPETEDEYELINPNQTLFTGLSNINLSEFRDLPLMDLKLQDLNRSIYDTYNLVQENIARFVRFQEENIKQVEKIAKLEKKIIPYSDDEIVSWKVK